MDSKPSLEKVQKLIQGILPDLDWVLGYMESKGGWLTLPPQLAAVARNLKVGHYAEVYVDERNMAGLILKLLQELSDPAEYQAMLAELNSKPGVEILEGWMDFAPALDEFDFHIPKSKAEVAAAKEKFEALGREEQARSIRAGQWFFAHFFATLFNLLALMVHGRKLTDLVAAAIEGNDGAFCLAAQIDRSTLVSIPYFVERIRRAHLEGDHRFFAKLGYRLSNPLLRGKIKYRQLWLCFAILDSVGYLDGTLKHREVLDLVDSIGVGRNKPKIRDVETITKQLRLYRRFQGAHSMSMQPK